MGNKPYKENHMRKQEFNKRLFNTKEFYHIVDKAVLGFGDMRKAKKRKLVSKELENHIMLVVTEVNGCQVCSYVHTKHALEMGMSEEDITEMLSETVEGLGENEGVALFFAQHYAEAEGQYDKEAWKRVVDTYGEEKAKGILGVIRGIMLGNAYGIESGALFSRIKGKPIRKSHLVQELGVTFSIVVFLPIAIVKNIFK